MDAVSDSSAIRDFKLLVLPGDGIGPEIVNETLRIVSWFSDYLALPIVIEEAAVGGASIDESGEPISDAVLEKAQEADAVLFGAVGGPKWDKLPRATRPEMGILKLRKELDLFANLRPAINYPELIASSSLRPEVVDSIDIMIVRESTAGVYFGEPRGITTDESGMRRAVDTQVYDESEIVRVCRAAFEIALRRDRRLCSVDKANVMETGVLWRTIATEIGRNYPDVALTHMYADNCAMQLLREPGQFDVIVTDNLFGDILSDEAAALSGSLGLLPSATLHLSDSQKPSSALYEPIHGSAPDIAGQGIANPLGSMLSFGMCLSYSMNVPDAADLLTQAVRCVLANGMRTPDIAAAGENSVRGSAMTDAIIEVLEDKATGMQRMLGT